MKGEVFLTLALLFLTSGVPAIAQKSLGGKETVVRVAAGAPLTLECPLRVEQPVQWQLNESAVPADMRAGGERAAGQGRLTARLHAAAARPHHAGVYTCSRGADAHRVRLHLAAAPSPAPAPAAAAAAADSGDGDGGDARSITELPSAPVLYYDINRNLTLNCSLTSADSSMPYVWKKNEQEVDVVPELKGRYKVENGGASLVLTARANEDDYGNYSCALGLDQLKWEVHGRPVARLPDNTNVVEGQKLKLQCKVIGKPYPRVSWTYNASEDSNESRPVVAGGRVSLQPNEQGAEDAALVLEAAERADAGVYACHAGAAGGLASDHTVLRVKDMYAALWPFLGICAEVFVLCAIILVYEKRRTKPELDDSDTDNHDQKKS